MSVSGVGGYKPAYEVTNDPAAEPRAEASHAVGDAGPLTSNVLKDPGLEKIVAGKAHSFGAGHRGSDARALQTALISLGYLSGAADGIFGHKSTSAVAAFQ